MPTPERMSTRDIDEYIASMGRGPAVDNDGQPTEKIQYHFEHGRLASIDRANQDGVVDG